MQTILLGVRNLEAIVAKERRNADMVTEGNAGDTHNKKGGYISGWALYSLCDTGQQ